MPYRLALIGNYASDLALRREINRFLVAEDPYGAMAFVRMGIERGEVRTDVDPEMTASILEWTVERFQDALLTEELDPGPLPPCEAPRREDPGAHRAIPGDPGERAGRSRRAGVPGSPAGAPRRRR